ncbi:threonine ammonia-lyase IlvA [Marinicrinis lubricantis]|uniref:L-threonine dehydratase n=1 Tax=Marinicrinis lubricantis TaxID=2086470 RepID=A0ABW1IL76_9BACL
MIPVEEILQAHKELKSIIHETPLQFNPILSQKYDCKVYLKREDLQVVRSFKIRGAHNFISSLSPDEQAKGVVCASAGNHAQGVAYSCKTLNLHAHIYMPNTTPKQKVAQVKRYGGSNVEIVLTGDTFDDALKEALDFCQKENKSFVHPFDDDKVIAGQGTVGVEIYDALQFDVDFVFAGIGGGGLISGIGSYLKRLNSNTRMIGVEALGAQSMKTSMKNNEIVTLDEVDKFADGVAVKRVGEKTFDICREVLDDIVIVPEGKICTTILELYNENAIVAEPAGAISVAALDFYKDEIKGKNVVCVISGGNNDIDRMPEIKEKSLIYEGLKHYFIIDFPQRAGALREFLDKVLGPDDDITRFEYTKKNSKDSGPALVGIELKRKEDYEPLICRMQEHQIDYQEINHEPLLFHLLI